jgi:hypothetical protein
MFSPGRLLTIGILGFLVYIGFYAVPDNAPGPGDFDPEAVARHEAAAWQAAVVREDMSVMINCILYQRELHRLSWFRAAESGMALSRAISQLPHMTSRFERVMPELEEVANVERAWKSAEFDAGAVARFQMNWIIMARNPQQANNAQRTVTEMADELGLRYGLQADFMQPVASDRAEAFRAVLARNATPDWEQVTELLTRSYTTLKAVLTRVADARAGL